MPKAVFFSFLLSLMGGLRVMKKKSGGGFVLFVCFRYQAL